MRKNVIITAPYWLLIVMFLGLSTGCTSGLSRSNAANLISKDGRFRKTLETQDDDSGENFIRAMKAQGYMDSSGKYTPKGEAAKANWTKFVQSYKYVYVPLGEREITEVTGISESKDATAEATFTWHWKPNEIGKAMNGQPVNLWKTTNTGRAVFQKFDDGWRVKQMQIDDYY